MRLIGLLIVLLLIPTQSAPEATFKQRVAKFKNSKRFEMRYDKFDDRTLVKVGPFYLWNELLKPENNFQMAAGFAFTGQKLAEQVDQFALIFVVNGDNWKFLEGRTLKMIADDERFDLGEADRTGKVGRSFFGDVRVKESLIVAVPAEVFAKMMTAKKVEMRLGQREFKLKDEHLQAFRDLMSLTKP